MKIKYVLTFAVFWISTLVVTAQQLNDLLNQAYDNNPQLKGIQLEYEAAMEKGIQVSQLPNPTIGAGLPILRPETRLGPQVLAVSASQMFPWFGTLKAKEDVVLTMAKAKYEQVAAERLNLDYQIKTAYYNLYLLQEQQEIIRKNIRIFETIEKVALSKVESGKSIASDVLSVQLKVEELKQQINLLEEQKQSHIASINQAITNPQYQTILISEEDISLAILDYDLEQFREKIATNHPIINQLDWNIEASNKVLALNTLSGKPTLGVGLDYMMVDKRSDASPTHNGRDIVVPKVMLSLPIYRKKYASVKREEELKQQALQLQKEDVTNKMTSNIQGFKADYESAKLMYELATKQIQISQSAYDILLAEYSSKGKRFDELMKLQSDMNRYEMEQIKAIVLSHIAVFKIEQLTDF